MVCACQLYIVVLLLSTLGASIRAIWMWPKLLSFNWKFNAAYFFSFVFGVWSFIQEPKRFFIYRHIAQSVGRNFNVAFGSCHYNFAKLEICHLVSHVIDSCEPHVSVKYQWYLQLCKIIMVLFKKHHNLYTLYFGYSIYSRSLLIMKSNVVCFFPN